jgi:hypothetical protein
VAGSGAGFRTALRSLIDVHLCDHRPGLVGGAVHPLGLKDVGGFRLKGDLSSGWHKPTPRPALNRHRPGLSIRRRLIRKSACRFLQRADRPAFSHGDGVVWGESQAPSPCTTPF